ncbi:peptide ABC transporter ATP-binding protein, partial [Klebsiella oxytoca]
LKARYEKEIQGEISLEAKKRNEILAKEIYLSTGRYGMRQEMKMRKQLLEALKKAMQLGVDLSNEGQLNTIFEDIV